MYFNELSQRHVYTLYVRLALFLVIIGKAMIQSPSDVLSGLCHCPSFSLHGKRPMTEASVFNKKSELISISK